ncbi:MAG: GGDEF domain-containing protein [Thermoleophilia bacterium]|nr:GGDEF domain-containing protein [Thermoleophilia bacterium]
MMDTSPVRLNRRNRVPSRGFPEGLALKAGASIRSAEEKVIRKWLDELIGGLGLASLESFPTAAIASGIPKLISSFAAAIEDSRAPGIKQQEMDEVSASLASLRKENHSLAKLLDDYARLKELLLEAVSADLRQSDRSVVNMARKMDEGFYRVLGAGLEAYVERYSRRLKLLADTDPLTGLYNVRCFRRELHRQLELYKRYRIAFSLLMLDLDGLKQLNDARGHAAGDVALRNLASVIGKEKRETDIAFRYGGDEFFLLLPGTATGEGERLGQRISRRVRELNLRTSGVGITGVSIGIVSCPDNGTDVGALRSRADQAMYLAKTLGGGTVARHRGYLD